MNFIIGLGTLLRQLTTLTDGGIQLVYDEMGVDFRPRYFPFGQALLRADAIGVSAIAQLTGTTKPAASQTLREMQRAGLVSCSNGDDRRKRLVSLSPQGRETCARLVPVWRATACAVAAIGDEISADIGAVLAGAIGAIGRHGFDARIREHLI